MEAEVKTMRLLEGCCEPRNVGSLWKLEKAGNKFSTRASRRDAALSTPWLYPSETHLEFRAERYIHLLLLCNKEPRTWQPKTTPIYYLAVLVLCLGLHKAEIKVLPRLSFCPEALGKGHFQVHSSCWLDSILWELRSLFPCWFWARGYS